MRIANQSFDDVLYSAHLYQQVTSGSIMQQPTYPNNF